MNSNPIQSTIPKAKSRWWSIFLEAVFVTIVGAVVAFAANVLSPRGLTLTRNYFPPGPTLVQSPIAVASPANSAPTPLPPSPFERLQANGLQPIASDRATELFHDPRSTQELIVFIDARDEQHYQEGHIPGAFTFDRYHPEQYLAAVLSVCQNADQIVVYCNGGECEDSQFAALTLRDGGIANTKLFVYAGGITEWVAQGLPVELGERNSGRLRQGSQ
jgi:rhodanese-related sulfurtransferase